MADLSQLLNDGVVPVINAGQELQVGGEPQPPAALRQQVDDQGVSIADIQSALADGINLPEIAGASAEGNSIFFNTDNDRVCWKSSGGLIFKFNMQLI